MSPSLVIVIYSLIFIFLLTLSIFSFITLRRMIIDYRERKWQRLYQLIEQKVLEAIFSSDLEISRHVAFQYRAFPAVLTQVLLNYNQVVCGEAKNRLQLIFDLALRERCRRLLHSPFLSRRLKAVRLFFFFFDPTAKELFLKILNDKPLLRLVAMTAVARVSDPALIDFIFQAFEKETGHLVRSYFYLMTFLGEKAEPYVKEALKRPLPLDKIALLLELVGAIPLRGLAPELQAWATCPEKEIRIKVARSLGKLLVPETLPTLHLLAQDEAWEVQAQAVKSLGYFKDPSSLEIVTQGLFSPFWYVRYNAARALANWGKEGITRLRKIASQNQDLYARDMSLMILNELIILGEIS